MIPYRQEHCKLAKRSMLWHLAARSSSSEVFIDITT